MSASNSPNFGLEGEERIRRGRRRRKELAKWLNLVIEHL
jgi:hypothetical protein